MAEKNAFNDFQQKAFSLCQAVYRLIAFFPEREILGEQIKETANAVTADVLTIERVGKKIPLNIAASSVKDLFDELTLSIIRNSDKLISYLQIARTQNWVAEVNFDVLADEYRNLGVFLQSRDLVVMSKAEPMSDYSPGDFPPMAGIGQNDYYQQSQVPKLVPVKRSKSVVAAKQNFNKEINPRQKKMIDFLRKNREAKMADFLGIFKNEVTERTLRNDLRALTEKKMIRAEGEFKTRKYFVK